MWPCEEENLQLQPQNKPEAKAGADQQMGKHALNCKVERYYDIGKGKLMLKLNLFVSDGYVIKYYKR